MDTSVKKAMFSNKNLSMSRMHFQEAQMPHDYIYLREEEGKSNRTCVEIHGSMAWLQTR